MLNSAPPKYGNSLTVNLTPVLARESPAHVNIDVFVSRIKAMAAQRPNDPLFQNLALIFSQMIGGFDAITGSLSKEQPLVITNPLLGATIKEYQLTVNTTIFAPFPAVIGALLVITLIQDNIGGHTVIFDTSTVGTKLVHAPAPGSTAANTYSNYLFVGRQTAGDQAPEWYWLMNNTGLST